jgi:hypothetical protein
VQLTPAGLKLISSIFPEHVARIEDMFKVLDAEQQASLGSFCRLLGTAASTKVHPLWREKQS